MIDRETTKDVLFQNAFDYHKRLTEDKYLDEKSKIASDIYFYNKDILEIITEARKHISESDLKEILDKARETFNFHDIIIS